MCDVSIFPININFFIDCTFCMYMCSRKYGARAQTQSESSPHYFCNLMNTCCGESRVNNELNNTG